jgi:hypothetical protein
MLIDTQWVGFLERNKSLHTPKCSKAAKVISTHITTPIISNTNTHPKNHIRTKTIPTNQTTDKTPSKYI